VANDLVSNVPTRPEDMQATVDFRIGDRIRLQATARITPVGLICVGLASAAITFAACYGVALARRRSGG
jgi:hypothetical protein